MGGIVHGRSSGRSVKSGPNRKRLLRIIYIPRGTVRPTETDSSAFAACIFARERSRSYSDHPTLPRTQSAPAIWYSTDAFVTIAGRANPNAPTIDSSAWRPSKTSS
jgi:hypothetical protein